ncbi:MAG: hypothetical protein C4297_00995 [Gemmataceae bacterium]
MARKLIAMATLAAGLWSALPSNSALADHKKFNFELYLGRGGPTVQVYRGAPIAHYHVLYRDCPWEPWRLYGTYRSHCLAHEVADELEWQGFETRIVHHREFP